MGYLLGFLIAMFLCVLGVTPYVLGGWLLGKGFVGLGITLLVSRFILGRVVIVVAQK